MAPAASSNFAEPTAGSGDVDRRLCVRAGACARSRAGSRRDHPIHLPNRAIILTNDNSRGEGEMPKVADSSAPISPSSGPISVAVNEYVAARRLGLSVDTLRRDRRLGHVGIPFIKLGSGKHGTVRYDLVDLDRFLETKKRRTLPPSPPQILVPPVAHRSPKPSRPSRRSSLEPRNRTMPSRRCRAAHRLRGPRGKLSPRPSWPTPTMIHSRLPGELLRDAHQAATSAADRDRPGREQHAGPYNSRYDRVGRPLKELRK